MAGDENGDCFPADTYREDGAFATAVWHREDVPDLPLEVPATWIVDDTIQKAKGSLCNQHVTSLHSLSVHNSLFGQSDARIVGIAVVGCSGSNHIQPEFS